MLNEDHLRRWRFWRKPPGRLDLTGILWPALGYPAMVEAHGRTAELIVLLCLPNTAVAPPSQFHARLRAPGVVVELRTLAAQRVTLDSVAGIGRWAQWVLDGAPSVVRLQLSVPCPELHRRTTIFDLEVECPGRHFHKAGAVALHKPGAEFRIALATDLHLAARWDEFEEEFSRMPGQDEPADLALTRFSETEAFSRRTILNTYVNPNHNLGLFIRAVNALAERDKADAVILSGDLVDYKFSRHRSEGGTAFADTSWKLLHDLLLGATGHTPRLNVPLFTSTGNHDYRLYPYRFRTYGMRHAGLPDEVSERHLRAQGEWRWWKYAPGDLDAIRIDSGDAHSLDYYFREFNPCLDYEVSLGGTRFLMLDSGPDAITNLGHLSTVRRRRFTQGLRNLTAPHSDGFGDRQIEYLQRWFGETGEQTAVVISHAPLIFPPEQSAALLKVPAPGAGSASEFERMLTDRGLDRRGIFGNQLPVFQALRAHPGPALFFAGHCHTEAEMVLDRETGHLHHRHGALGQTVRTGASGSALLFHTPSLGHGHPQYRLIRLRGGAVEGAALVPLLEKPIDEWIYDWTWRRAGGATEHIEFYFLRRVAGAAVPGLAHRLILRFSGSGVADMKVTVDDPPAVTDSCLELAGPAPAYASWVIRDVPAFQIALRGRPKGTRISFLYETVQDRQRSGLRWHPRVYP